MATLYHLGFSLCARWISPQELEKAWDSTLSAWCWLALQPTLMATILFGVAYWIIFKIAIHADRGLD